MTPEEKLELKTNIKKLFLEHLTDLGYPNITNQDIMNELPALWQKMCDSGFYREGMSFQAFVDIAHQHAIISEILGVVRQ